MYRALFPTNVPVDFIHINEIAEGKAGRYKLILLQYPLMITQPAAKGLSDYVRAGGTLMAEARLAWNDERGFAREIIPGFGLHEVCGCRETSVQQTASGKTEIEIVVRDDSVPFLPVGAKVRGAVYEEVLQPISGNARVIGEFPGGGPAIVASVYGRGRMVAVGSFLGMLYESERDERVAKFFAGLLDWAGVSRPVEVVASAQDQPLEARTMDLGGGKLVFVFNHGEAACDAAVRVKLPAGSYTGQDLLAEETVAAPYDRNGVLIKKRLSPRGVWVVRISAK
jgi:beta-galactosidase